MSGYGKFKLAPQSSDFETPCLNNLVIRKSVSKDDDIHIVRRDTGKAMPIRRYSVREMNHTSN